MKKNPAGKVRVYAVWLPILSFDSRPGDLVLRRMTDRRVRQFWDSGRLVAEEVAHHGDPRQKEPECCFHRRGVLWDLAAVYPPGGSWGERLPLASVFGGPVISQTEAIRRELANVGSRSKVP